MFLAQSAEKPPKAKDRPKNGDSGDALKSPETRLWDAACKIRELKKNDYNISPSRYIHTSDAETYRPIAEIVEELKVIEAEARETDKALEKILKQLGV